MTTLRPHTKTFNQAARDLLGTAVIRARQAMGHMNRPSFLGVCSDIGMTSLVKLETGKPVGPDVYEAVARTLPQWTVDTPREILERGRDAIPPTAAEVAELERETTGVNEKMLTFLLGMRSLLAEHGASAEEIGAQMDSALTFWRQRERDTRRFRLTLDRFNVEWTAKVAERDSQIGLRENVTPFE